MRLISQDGMIDVPYENVCVSINYRNKNQITAWNFGCEDCEIVTMATYSNTDKALKVMEMLRNAYTGKNCGYHTEHGVCYHSRNDFETKVFYFPKDEDVEVQDE